MKKSHYKNLSNYEILKMNFINKEKIFDGKNIQVFNYKFEKRQKLQPKLLYVRAFSPVYNPKMALMVLQSLLKKPDTKK